MARFLQDSFIREGYQQAMLHPDIKKAGYFFHRLYSLNIWPVSTRLRTLNLDFIQRAIAEFEEPEFKERLVTEIVRAVERQKGLCLWCVRKGKMSSREGNCVRICGFLILSSRSGPESHGVPRDFPPCRLAPRLLHLFDLAILTPKNVACPSSTPLYRLAAIGQSKNREEVMTS